MAVILVAVFFGLVYLFRFFLDKKAKKSIANKSHLNTENNAFQYFTFSLLFFVSISTSAISEASNNNLQSILYQENRKETKLEPIGGYPKFYHSIKRNLKYPKKAKKNKIEGVVEIQFVVNKEGEMTTIKLSRSLELSCNLEAIKRVKLNTVKWKSTTNNEEISGQIITLSFKFNLKEGISVGVLNREPFYIVAEIATKPIGGYSVFYEKIHRNFRYPKEARQKGYEGKVYVLLTISKKGEISDIKILQGLEKSCNQEAIRLVKLTKWKAAKQRGVFVEQKVVIPISFIFTPLLYNRWENY